MITTNEAPDKESAKSVFDVHCGTDWQMGLIETFKSEYSLTAAAAAETFWGVVQCLFSPSQRIQRTLLK